MTRLLTLTQTPTERRGENSEPSGAMLYFVYGSNMNSAQLQARGVRPTRTFTAKLPGHRLTFHGHSRTWDGGLETVVSDPEQDVYGVVLVLSSTEADALDSCQGVRLDGTGSHFHFPTMVYDTHGDGHEVLIFKLDVLGEPRKPSREYLECIVSGALERNLPPLYVDRLTRLEARKADYAVPVPGRLMGAFTIMSCAGCGQDDPFDED
ncbi:gamma-glutamylcyclotransferase [Desulfovibrio sulfodismutans]|uniref:Gamma-glutamylcyclotransferase n=1 Tax=Desulfolutivibrio sulfodismutans TaxID=63561 RepID=A0A7K3NGD3_9BACT|nr:gamma-glutamylcyclotransferase family protein [Desulfolutivibrio sulfodismutans]NDY55246.1 gamma-glutamylcyclotransferase [Desulfolutivibrio sulfodismutans]QLA12979.1 gamma-glutamylcyclotransferase [Desulfolutivibrio sulfodismutans DSM 3696]